MTKEEQFENLLRISGTDVRKCMKCGKCSGRCPAFKDMDIKPHQFVSLLAKGKAEDGKVAVRNIRRKAKESLDKAIKDGEMGEDDGDRLLKELDKVTKQTTDELDTLLEAKQKEIMEV